MLVQEQIEQFAYFFLPRDLRTRTHTLCWPPEQAGYAVTRLVRHLWLVLWQAAPEVQDQSTLPLPALAIDQRCQRAPHQIGTDKW